MKKRSGINWKLCPKCGAPLRYFWRVGMGDGRHIVKLAEEGDDQCR